MRGLPEVRGYSEKAIRPEQDCRYHSINQGEKHAMIDDSVLVGLLIEWQRKLSSDSSLTVESFLRDRPELVDAFKKFLRDLGPTDSPSQEGSNYSTIERQSGHEAA